MDWRKIALACVLTIGPVYYIGNREIVGCAPVPSTDCDSVVVGSSFTYASENPLAFLYASILVFIFMYVLSTLAIILFDWYGIT
jgi:hypothetical protein